MASMDSVTGDMSDDLYSEINTRDTTHLIKSRGRTKQHRSAAANSKYLSTLSLNTSTISSRLYNKHGWHLLHSLNMLTLTEQQHCAFYTPTVCVIFSSQTLNTLKRMHLFRQ